MAHQPLQSSTTSRYSQLVTAAPQRTAGLRGRLWGGWRTTVATGAIITSVALVVNVAILIWASKQKPPDGHVGAGVVTLYSGSCTGMSKIFTWSHLALNVVSTLLLSAGAACMQCLSAPTRQEVDRAHSHSTWLDVGIPSVRNLKWIARQRMVLWALLGLSSVPLHLFYNSTVFSTTATNDYHAIIVADNFLHGGPWTGNEEFNIDNSYVHYLQDNISTLKKLKNEDCIRVYETDFVSDYKDVLLVTAVSNTTNAILGITPQLVGRQSGEGDACSDGLICGHGSQNNATDWTFVVFPGAGVPPLNTLSSYQLSGLQKIPHNTVSVQYCLAKPSSPVCTISLSRVYLGVVIICNVIKLVCIIWTLALKSHHPLVTIGDAIESFLVQPDMMTRTTFLSASELRKQKVGSQWCPTSTRPWFPIRRVWFEAASARRCAVIILCLVAVWTTALALLVEGVKGSSGQSNIWQYGLGGLNLNTILTFSKSYGVTADVLIVNSPQVVLSLIYILYNGLFTCMLLSAEYLKFATQRSSLRVTDPRNTQRSTYWLQLPYRYAIPFLVAMGVLHWLVSQSIFLVRIVVIDLNGNPDYGREIGGCGWSPNALVATVVLGALMILTLFGFGFKKLPNGMPVASSCSAAISAACHRADGEGEDIALLPLQYGVLKGKERGFQEVGFSAEEVEPLEPDVFYKCWDKAHCRDDEVDDY